MFCGLDRASKMPWNEWIGRKRHIKPQVQLIDCLTRFKDDLTEVESLGNQRSPYLSQRLD